MPSSEKLESVERAIRQMLEEETAPYVADGRAMLEVNETYQLSPRRNGACCVGIYAQSDAEVSLWPTAPGTDRAPTVDVFDKDPDRLVETVREYVRAIMGGRLELTLRKDSSAGRCRIWLASGSEQTHLYNVIFGFLVGRGQGWETFRPEPY